VPQITQVQSRKISNKRKRPDNLFVTRLDQEITLRCADVAVTDPTQAKFTHNKKKPKKCYPTQGKAALLKEKEKVTHYAKEFSVIAGREVIHNPIVLEAYGAWGKKGVAFVEHLCDIKREQVGESDPLNEVSEFRRRIYAQVSRKLWKHNAKIVLDARLKNVAGEIGHHMDPNRLCARKRSRSQRSYDSEEDAT
jgi:hypothetical protein